MAGIQHAARLDDHQLHFFFRNRLVLHAFGYNEHFTRAEEHRAVAKIDAQLAFDDEKRLVRFRMIVPDELAFDFREFELVESS